MATDFRKISEIRGVDLEKELDLQKYNGNLVEFTKLSENSEQQINGAALLLRFAMVYLRNIPAMFCRVSRTSCSPPTWPTEPLEMYAE